MLSLQIKQNIDRKDDLLNIISSKLRISQNDILSFDIVKKSIDARDKQNILYLYSVNVFLKDEKKESIIVKKNPDFKGKPINKYNFPSVHGEKKEVVIVGFGPAGLFAAYFLSKSGFKVTVLERGYDVDTRTKDVDEFWTKGSLKLNSNVSFGEGGAGTFSDGKLNTQIKDSAGRILEVLKIFVQHGAPENIIYDNKPHIGTDVLKKVIKSMREEIISLGGEIHFREQVESLVVEQNCLKAVRTPNNAFYGDRFIFAIGHSARDTFEMLFDSGVIMEPKQFAIGVRVMHDSDLISKAQYGDAYKKLPTADYKVTYNGARGVYSFCMCPGGYVVNASSEYKGLVVNGMSYSDRAGKFSNSAIIVSVSPEDYLKETGRNDALAGIDFQRKFERKAFEEGLGKIPVELYGKDAIKKYTDHFDELSLGIKGEYTSGKVQNFLPCYVYNSLIEGMSYFGSRIEGFESNAIYAGLETRTSSPVKIVRNDVFQSNIKNLYPCGEGAGYAGGIVSAAVDGIKVFEQICSSIK